MNVLVGKVEFMPVEDNRRNFVSDGLGQRATVIDRCSKGGFYKISF